MYQQTMGKPERLPYQQLNEDSLQAQREELPIASTGTIYGNPNNTPQPYPQVSGNQLQQQHTQPPTAPIEQMPGQREVMHIVHVKLARNLGITQVVIGTLCFFVGIILLILDGVHLLSSITATGIWGGVFISIAGMLSICSAHAPTRYCTKCAALTMNIISVLSAPFGMVISYVSIGDIINDCYEDPYFYNPQPYPTYDPNYYYRSYCQNATVLQNLTIVLALLMSMEFIISILSAIVTGCGCSGCECCSRAGGGTQQMTYIIPARPFPPSTSTIYQPYPPSTTVVGNQPPPYHNSQLPVATTTSPPLGSMCEPGNSCQGNAPPQMFYNNTNIPPSSTHPPPTTHPAYNTNQSQQQAPGVINQGLNSTAAGTRCSDNKGNP